MTMNREVTLIFWKMMLLFYQGCRLHFPSSLLRIESMIRSIRRCIRVYVALGLAVKI